MKALKKKATEAFSLMPRYAENYIDTAPETAEALPEIGGSDYAAVPHAEAGEIQNLKTAIKGHGEQTVLPDECQYCDNDLCFVEA